MISLQIFTSERDIYQLTFTPLYTDINGKSLESIKKSSYLFTDGSSAFLNRDGTSIINSIGPTSTSPSNVKLILPQLSSTSQAAVSQQKRPNIRSISIEIIPRTRMIYKDLCRVDIAYRVKPNLRLEMSGVAEVIISGGLSFVCQSFDKDKVCLSYKTQVMMD